MSLSFLTLAAALSAVSTIVRHMIDAGVALVHRVSPRKRHLTSIQRDLVRMRVKRTRLAAQVHATPGNPTVQDELDNVDGMIHRLQQAEDALLHGQPPAPAPKALRFAGRLRRERSVDERVAHERETQGAPWEGS